MKLQPKTHAYKKKQKKRTLFFFKKNTSLKFNNSGLLLLKAIWLTAKRLNRLKLFLKKAIRKSDRTHRYFWFNSFPHFPLTRKAINSRMGKGRGKLKTWYTNINSGSILFEFINLRSGRSLYFMKQVSFKLGIPTKGLLSSDIYINFHFLLSKKKYFRTFW